MNRRSFGFGLLAAGTLPLAKLPLAVAAPAPAAAANFTPFMYSTARLMAQMNGSFYPAQLVQSFGISTEAAAAINSKLIKTGVITAANAAGVSRPIGTVIQEAKPVANRPLRGADAQKWIDKAQGKPAPETEETMMAEMQGEDLPETTLSEPEHADGNSADAQNPSKGEAS